MGRVRLLPGVLLPSLPAPLPGTLRARAAEQGLRRRAVVEALHALLPGAHRGALETLGRDLQAGPPRHDLRGQHRRQRPERDGLEDPGRAGRHHGRRQPGAQRREPALAQRRAGQGPALGGGAEGHHRDLRDQHRHFPSLDALREGGGRAATLDGGGGGQRLPPLVDALRRGAEGPALDEGGRGVLCLVPPQRGLPAEHRVPGPGRGRLLAADGPQLREGGAGSKVYDHFNGIYHALVESRIPFDLVHDRCLEPERVARYALLVLPNVACLSDAQCGQLRDYVRLGGSLVATLETSLYDEGGERRRDFGLGDLLGVSVRKGLQGPLRNSYMRFESDAAGRRHPLLAGFEDTEQTVNGIWMVDVAGTAPAEPPMTLIPPYPDLPMEKVFPTVPRTDVPTVYAREAGRSRIVYFPIDIDRVFWEVLHPDHLRILRNAFAWASGGSRPVEVEGPGLVEVTLWRQERSLTVHLVNLSNPMMFKGPVRELLPVGGQRVTIEVPPGARVRAVKLLVSGAPVAHTASAGRITLTVPRVLDREVVAVDLA